MLVILLRCWLYVKSLASGFFLISKYGFDLTWNQGIRVGQIISGYPTVLMISILVPRVESDETNTWHSKSYKRSTALSITS